MGAPFKVISLELSVDEPVEFDDFEEIPVPISLHPVPRPRRRWPGFAWSVLIHAAAIATMANLPAGRPRPPRNLWERSRMVQTLRLRVPENLYLASTGSPGRPKPAPAPKPAAPKAAEGAKPRAAEARPRAGGRRPFELPPAVRAADTDQTILQPLSQTGALPVNIRLPEIFFWNTERPRPRAVKPFVDPGHVKTPQAPRVLDAPPRLNTAGAPPTPKVPASTALAPSARLLAPPPSLPIRAAAQNTANSSSGTDDPQSGDPVAVLSLTSKPLPLREFLTIPPGNMVGRMPAQGEGGSGQGSGQGAGKSKSGGAAGEGSGETGTGRGAAGAGSGSASGSDSGNGGGGGAAGSGAGGSSAGVSGALDPAVAATRMTHPVDGVFDVVVQGGLDGLPESAGALSGRPIYSVYLNVGGAKDWILQYCVPAGGSPAPRASGGVVTLDAAPPPLSAPYPQVTMRPLVRRRPGTYMTVQGFINTDGRFENLRVLGANDPQQSAYVLAILEKWEFRPAMQLQKAVRVEILLAIPSE
jgi:hypothetical protein